MILKMDERILRCTNCGKCIAISVADPEGGTWGTCPPPSLSILLFYNCNLRLHCKLTSTEPFQLFSS